MPRRNRKGRGRRRVRLRVPVLGTGLPQAGWGTAVQDRSLPLKVMPVRALRVNYPASMEQLQYGPGVPPSPRHSALWNSGRSLVQVLDVGHGWMSG
jgi:hypothetical protein